MRQFTVAALWDLGIRGDVDSDEWLCDGYGGAVVDTRPGEPHKSYRVLECTHPPETPSWERFVAAMLEHHGVVVPETVRPSWVNP